MLTEALEMVRIQERPYLIRVYGISEADPTLNRVPPVPPSCRETRSDLGLLPVPFYGRT